MVSSKRYATLDIFRLFFAFLIIAIHTSPLLSFNDTADFILTRIFARLAVPFFFMVTGYFLYLHKGNKQYIGAFYKKIAVIYSSAILLYLPLNFYTGYFGKSEFWRQIGKDIFFNGTFYHLWYFPAVMVGFLLVILLVQKTGFRTAFIIAIILYMIGLCGDSYYGLITQIPFVKAFYDLFFKAFDYTRNGVLYAPIFLMLGAWIFNTSKRMSYKKCILGLIVSAVLLVMEGLFLHNLVVQRHDSMYLMLLPCMFFLFQLLLQTNGKSNKNLRTISMLIYLVHPWMIVLVRGFAKATGLHKLLVDNSYIHYLAVSLLSFATAWIWVFVWAKIKKPTPTIDSRAWVEVDLSAIRHNAKILRELLPKQCELMAVVKANAYGHGDVTVTKELFKSGIHAFAVATLTEGVHLRKHGIKGEILILGYTNPCDATCLVRYRLTQTVVDYAYAKALNTSGKKIKVHLKIDTGMHRLGVDAFNLSEIEYIYECNNLVINGIFSHLSVSDSLNEEDVTYTQLQISRFFDTIAYLKSKGYPTGKLHIQASYGIINYPDLPCDYARAGIALYGVLSSNDKTHSELDLLPAISVRARVAMVKQIASGESVSYGKLFTAKATMKIAIVTIGYADGIQKNLYQANPYVLIHTQRAPIIGRICMDQLIIDVTNIAAVEPNDIVTLIGLDGMEQIRCEDFAEQCGTITNEILSRLGSRLNYKFIQ